MQTLVEYALANWFVDVQQLCQLLQTGRLATLVGAHRGGEVKKQRAGGLGGGRGVLRSL